MLRLERTTGAGVFVLGAFEFADFLGGGVGTFFDQAPTAFMLVQGNGYVQLCKLQRIDQRQCKCSSLRMSWFQVRVSTSFWTSTCRLVQCQTASLPPEFKIEYDTCMHASVRSYCKLQHL